jgi:hypothetical protein
VSSPSPGATATEGRRATSVKPRGTEEHRPSEVVCNRVCNESELRRQIADAIIAGDDARADELRAMLQRPLLRVVR